MHFLSDRGAIQRAETFYSEFDILENPGRIRRRSEEEWERTEKYFTGYVYQRHLEPSPERSDGQTYNEMLPPHHGLRLVDLVNDEIARRKENAEPGQPIQPVVIVDVGYGAGQALLDMSEKWGPDVFLVGYGTSALTKIEGESTRMNPETGSTYTRLLDRGVQLVEGNAIDIRKRLKEEFGENFRADFLLACFSVSNVFFYPKYEILKKLYRTLRLPANGETNTHGGILLINSFYDSIFEGEPEERLFAHLQDRGYSLEDHGMNGVSLERTPTHSDFPPTIRTIQIEHKKGWEFPTHRLRR